MSWTTVLANAGVNRFCTRIEIKPHNRDGVSDGVKQLLGVGWASLPNPNCTPGRTMKRFLITYEELSPISAIYRAWILEVTPAVKAVVSQRGWSMTSLGFRQLGALSVPTVNQTMLVRECHTARGAALEKALRVRYAQEMNQRFATRLNLATKPGSATGPDIDHEFAEFLAELAAELQPTAGWGGSIS